MKRPDVVEVHDRPARSAEENHKGRSGAESSSSVRPVTPPNSLNGDTSAPESLGRRFMRPQTLISFAIAAFIIAFFFRRLNIDPGAVWQHARQANLLLVGLAFVVFYAGFIVRAFRWRRMLARAGISERAGYHVPGNRGMIEIFLLSWFANCVVPAKLGDAYRSYLFKRESRASFSTTFGTILAERLTDLTVLFGAMSIMGLIVFHGHMPGQATQTFYIGAVLMAVGTIGLAVMWLARDTLQRWLPERLRAQYARLHDAIFACLRRPSGFVALSGVVWLGEGLRVFLVAYALGAQISIPTAIFVALMASLLTTMPITPAGLGVVEGAMIVVLTLVGVQESMAGAIALIDRVIGYWSLIVVGLPLYLRRVKRDMS